jgi:hypothetical protein
VQTILINRRDTADQGLDVTAKHRLFNMMDKSDEVTFPNLVLNDRTLAEERIAGADYQRQTADADARWQLMPSALTRRRLEHWNRNEHVRSPSATSPMPRRLST